MDIVAFFESVRRENGLLFGATLTQRQVDGIEALLDACDGFPLPWAAHVLAEVFHETGGGMWPVRETVYPSSVERNPSNATVIARLDRAWANKQLPWVLVPYWRDGWFGRGQIQLTHEKNYRAMSPIVGFDLVADPDLALQVDVSAKIAAEGCRRGMFTGLKLADFDRGDVFDHYNARAIVNGDKGKNGETVRNHALAFERALGEAGWGQDEPPAMPPPPVHVVKPVAAPTGFISLFLEWLKGLKNAR